MATENSPWYVLPMLPPPTCLKVACAHWPPGHSEALFRSAVLFMSQHFLALSKHWTTCMAAGEGRQQVKWRQGMDSFWPQSAVRLPGKPGPTFMQTQRKNPARDSGTWATYTGAKGSMPKGLLETTQVCWKGRT